MSVGAPAREPQKTWDIDSLKRLSSIFHRDRRVGSGSDDDGEAVSGNSSDSDGDRVAVRDCKSAVDRKAPADISANPVSDPAKPGDGFELPAAELASQTKVIFPPDTAAARTAQGQLTIYIRGPGDNAPRTLSRTSGQSPNLASESSAPDNEGVVDARIPAPPSDKGECSPPHDGGVE